MTLVDELKVMHLNQRILELWKRINTDSSAYFDDDKVKITIDTFSKKTP
jgi:hypothetical protein